VSTDSSLSRSQRTLRNVAWLGSTQAIRQVVAIGTTIVLARFLGPKEFGVFAMMIFVNELAQMFVDFGMGSALVQRKEVDSRLLSSCFWLNLFIGGVAALLLAVLGPWIAAYFEQPILRWLLLLSGLNLIVAAASVLPQSLLSRELSFRDIALGTLVGSLSGSVSAIALAVSGAGVWALAAQPLVGGTITMLYWFVKSRWLPRLLFSATEVRGVLGFSGQILGSSLVMHVTRNLTSLILGPAMGAAALGTITMAQTVTWLPIAQFSQAVVRATFPVFAQMQHDMERFRASLYRTSGAVALLAFPMLVGIAILSDDLMLVVFGPKWSHAAPLVAVLCAASLVQSVTSLAGTTLMAIGRGGWLFGATLAGMPVMAAALWATREGNVMQAVVGLTTAGIAVQLILLGTGIRAIGGRWRDYLSPLWRPLLCSGLMALPLTGSVALAGAWPPAVRLVTLSVVGAVIYIGASFLLNRAAVLDLLTAAGVRRRR
jgi:PST family polysaccharide transporter